MEPAGAPQSDRAAAATTAVPRRRRRMTALLVGALLLGLPLLGLSWLLLGAGAPAAVAALAGRLAGERLTIEGAQGRLIGPLTIVRIAYRDGDLRFDAHGIRLDWQAALSARPDVRVPQLDLAALDVATRPTGQPAQRPDDLRLPLSLRVERLQVGRLRLLAWAPEAATPPVLAEIRDIGMRFESDGRRHAVSGVRLSTPWAALAGEATLDGAPPFQLAAKLHADGALEDKAYRIDATLDGPLESVAVAARASGWNLAGEAALSLTPFEPVPLRRAKLSVGEIDPAAFAAGAPHAALRIEADLAPRATDGGAAVPIGQWVLAGPLGVVNRAPAPFDRQGLPIARLDARAQWQAGRLSLDDLVVTSPGAAGSRDSGRLSGTAVLETGATPRIRLQLAAGALDPRAWVSTLKPARLSGSIEADATAQAQTVDARLRESGTPTLLRSGPPWQAELSLRHRDGVLELRRVRLAAGEALLDAAGRLDLGGARAFELGGKLAQFDPSRYADVPAARLSADLAARGELRPGLRADLRFDLHDSRIATRGGMRALAGRGTLRVDGGRLAESDIALDLAGNRLQAGGGFGRPGDVLAFSIDAPRLDAIGIGLAGRIEAQGRLGGTPERPSGEVTAHARALRAGSALRLDAATLTAKLGEGADGRLDAVLEVDRLRTDAAEAAQVERASLSVAGTRGSHVLQGSARLAGGFALRTAARGALTDGPAWRGRLDALEIAQGEHRMALVDPVSLSASAERVELGRAELRGSSAVLRIAEAAWAPAGWSTRGELSGLQVGVSLDTQQQLVLRGRTLTLGGAWDLRSAAQLEGSLALRREAGDLAVEGDIPVELGLRELGLRVDARQGGLDFALDAEGEKIGRLDLRARLAEVREGGAWKPAARMPLQGTARFAMPSVAWIGPLLGPNVQVGGALGGSFDLSGTLGRPQARGNIRAAGVNIALVEHGLRLTDGEVEIELTQERARLTRLDFRADPRVRPNERRIDFDDLAGKPGRLRASGEIELAGGKGSLRFEAERLAVLQRADRWLMMSGEAQLATSWDALALTGRLAADAGHFELAAAAAPALDDDVVILGRQARPARPLRLDVDLSLDLGHRLYFKGRGLDARLRGDLRLRADARTPLRATGSIRTREGTYDAYGQVLSIERGIINFQGPLESAGLNVRALRTGLPVEAGVEIDGTVQAPRVRLVSDPQVPDSEKLSWIVLGRGQDQAGGADSALLLSAADAILGGQIGGISRGLAQGLGLDQIAVTSGDIGGGSRMPGTTVAGSTLASRDANLTSQIVTLGKRISTDAYLSYEHSLAGAASVVRLTYNLTRQLSVVGRAGTDNSLDLQYSISFR